VRARRQASDKKYVHNKDEVVVVIEPKLADIGLSSRVVKGLWNLLRRPCKSQEESRESTSGTATRTRRPAHQRPRDGSRWLSGLLFSRPS